MQKIIILVLTSLFAINLVYAAPFPWGFALNHQTKECAGYWAGDEYGYNPLPKGWEVYYFYKAENIKLINSSFGIRRISDEFISDDKKIIWENYCKSIGFSPADYKEFDKSSQQILNEKLITSNEKHFKKIKGLEMEVY